MRIAQTRVEKFSIPGCKQYAHPGGDAHESVSALRCVTLRDFKSRSSAPKMLVGKGFIRNA